jgi:hypothetical protein
VDREVEVEREEEEEEEDDDDCCNRVYRRRRRVWGRGLMVCVCLF